MVHPSVFLRIKQDPRLFSVVMSCSESPIGSDPSHSFIFFATSLRQVERVGPCLFWIWAAATGLHFGSASDIHIYIYQLDQDVICLNTFGVHWICFGGIMQYDLFGKVSPHLPDLGTATPRSIRCLNWQRCTSFTSDFAQLVRPKCIKMWGKGGDLKKLMNSGPKLRSRGSWLDISCKQRRPMGK